MSWFKRKPRVKEPPKHLPHHRNSSFTERLLKETKESTNPATKDSMVTDNSPSNKTKI